MKFSTCVWQKNMKSSYCFFPFRLGFENLPEKVSPDLTFYQDFHPPDLEGGGIQFLPKRSPNALCLCRNYFLQCLY